MEDISYKLGAVQVYDNDLVGYIRQIPFEGKFLIEDMDFRFRCPSVRQHFTPAKFVEILCLDSIGALHRGYERAETQVGTGVKVNKGQGGDGELVFLPHIPVQGVRIVIYEDLYESLQTKVSSGCFFDIRDSSMLSETNFHDPELRLVFGQIKRGIEQDAACEPYYENKIAEILYLIARAESAKNGRKRNSKRLARADAEAVDRVKSMIEARISEPPRMAELARMVNASVAKLQNDFKTAYGCTIHDYSQQIRMAEALRKIENSDEPLYSIALGVGYKNPSHFSEIFKNIYGVMPSEYIKLKKI
ncbi:MAG: AraC family transcriptional regulator [Holosporales bacterium]|jgi:AraC-like DNA-binding protein|nr:AraC family transcriptional regulator [Holosporales bacterium]